MTVDRPAQPGPPGDPPGGPPNPPNPPDPPGGRPLEERVAVVEARLDDLPTKEDLAKTELRLIDRINEVSEKLNEKLHRQVLIYLGVVGFAVGTMIGFQEWRDRGRQQQIEGVQNQIQGVQSQIQGMQQQINLLLEHLLGGKDMGPQVQGQEREPQVPQGGEQGL